MPMRLTTFANRLDGVYGEIGVRGRVSHNYQSCTTISSAGAGASTESVLPVDVATAPLRPENQ